MCKFDNLSKTVCFSLYFFYYFFYENDVKAIIEYINKKYNSNNIDLFINDIADIIDANIISISKYDFDICGASVNALCSDPSFSCAINTHLDKSHICTHSYIDFNFHKHILSFRIDLEISTCGSIIAEKSIKYVLKKFNADIIVMDIIIRGYRSNNKFEKIYFDNSIKESIEALNTTEVEKYDIVYMTNNFKYLKCKMIKNKKYYRDYLGRSDVLAHNNVIFESINDLIKNI